MSHRKEAPFVLIVFKTEHKLSRRKLKKLVAIRLTFGKSTFFNSTSGAPRYPVEVIGPALIEAVYKAKRGGEQLELSAHEFRLWCQMFPGTGKGRSKPDRKNRQAPV